MNFWIVFGLVGLAFIVPIMMFLIGGVDIQHKIGGALVCFVFWGLMSAGLYCETTTKTDAWNGGYCECGTHWELRGANKDRYGNTTKYYVCPECFTEIEQ